MMELNLDFIKAEGFKNETENHQFRTFLKQHSAAKIDKIAHAIYEKVNAEIDCTQCGNCCKKLMPSPTASEIETLSKKTGYDSPDAFKIDLLQFDAKDQAYFFKSKPCSFLENNCCTVYEDRPQSCRDYPNLHKKDFIFRMLSVIGNYGICPIVYNTLEQLKGEMGFKREKN